jgi:hypothetical protein
MYFKYRFGYLIYTLNTLLYLYIMDIEEFYKMKMAELKKLCSENISKYKGYTKFLNNKIHLIEFMISKNKINTNLDNIQINEINPIIQPILESLSLNNNNLMMEKLNILRNKIEIDHKNIMKELYEIELLLHN